MILMRASAMLEPLRAEILELKEKVAFLESREVCAAAHENVETCGYCQRDKLAEALRNLLARVDDQFGSGDEYDWKEQTEARESLHSQRIDQSAKVIGVTMSITPGSIKRAIELLDAATVPDTERYVQIGDKLYYIDKNRQVCEVTAPQREGNQS